MALRHKSSKRFIFIKISLKKITWISHTQKISGKKIANDTIQWRLMRNISAKNIITVFEGIFWVNMNEHQAKFLIFKKDFCKNAWSKTNRTNNFVQQSLTITVLLIN